MFGPFETVFQSFINQILDASHSGDIEYFEEAGLSQDQVARLERLSINDTLNLCQTNRTINIEIDDDLLQHAIQSANEGIANSNYDTGNQTYSETTERLLFAISHTNFDHSHRQNQQVITGIEPATIELIKELSVRKIRALCKTGFTFYRITADSFFFEAALSHAETTAREENAIRELVQRDASWPMINYLTGMDKRPYQRLRKRFGLTEMRGGAPKQLSEDESVKVWEIWHSHSDLGVAYRCLKISRELDTAMRNVWPVLHKLIEGKDTESNIKTADV